MNHFVWYKYPEYALLSITSRILCGFVLLMTTNSSADKSIHRQDALGWDTTVGRSLVRDSLRFARIF